ncbi:MAG: TIR domain-containing protein [Candidatus Sericytochromatia bacterium]|nr:TIR domain-containing protein [Candidatus Sericytochromatia bacterium]
MCSCKNLRNYSWKYEDEYNKIIEFLQNAPNFTYRNYSVPLDDPLQTKTDKQLRDSLHNQIKPVNIVIVLAGMYVAYSKWIQAEIEIAQSYNKPIIGIRPWGGQVTPTAVSSAAKTVVAWQTSSIVDAIRTYSL